MDNLPLHPLSATYVSTINNTKYASGIRYDVTFPINIVPGTQPKVPINITWPDESDPGPYPIPPNAVVEPASDLHILLVDKDNCILYETFNSVLQADGSWNVDSAAKWDLQSNALRPDSWTSADAAGLPITPGVMRYSEVLAGEMNHALRFTAPTTQRLYLWPARHFASSSEDPALPPMGLRMRLKASYDISRFSANMQVILRAMKKYGIILADNGLPWSIQGDTDPRWDTDDLLTLRDVDGSNFEAVDESGLMMDYDSGQALQAGSAPAPAGVTVSPTSVTGGANVSVTVTLTSAAPSGGALVTLTGSNAAFPAASVTVGSGSVSQSFNVPTAVVSNTTTVTITASYNGTSVNAPTLTVNPPPTVSVTLSANVTGLSVTADGSSYTAPHLFTWVQGSSHTINVVSPQNSGNTRYLFSSWSDGGGQSHLVTALSSTTITASFSTQYVLTLGTSPSTGGSLSANPSSTDGYYNAGSTVQLTALPNTGCTFTGFSGDLTGSSNPQNLGMAAPRSVTASFSCQAATALQFVPITPCRIADTRAGSGFTGLFGAPSLSANIKRDVPVLSSSCGVPANAAVYSLNLTAVPLQGFSDLVAWPTGQAQPGTSNLHSTDGSVLADAALVAAGTGGQISVLATGNTDLVIDINGYFAPPGASSMQFFPMTPCRVIDTRNPNGTFGGPYLAGYAARQFPFVQSPCGISGSAKAYSLNVTVIPKGTLWYVTAGPAGQPLPTVSTLNDYAGAGVPLANAAIVPAGTNGDLTFLGSQDTDLIVDINGYFSPPATGGLNFYSVTPCRAADTRNAVAPLGGPVIPAYAVPARSFPLPQGSCGLPSSAGAYSLNISTYPTAGLWYLTAWPAGQTAPLVSSLNDYKGLPTANAALVPAGTGGAVNVLVSQSSHVAIDVNGYFAQ